MTVDADARLPNVLRNHAGSLLADGYRLGQVRPIFDAADELDARRAVADRGDLAVLEAVQDMRRARRALLEVRAIIERAHIGTSDKQKALETIARVFRTPEPSAGRKILNLEIGPGAKRDEVAGALAAFLENAFPPAGKPS